MIDLLKKAKKDIKYVTVKEAKEGATVTFKLGSKAASLEDILKYVYFALQEEHKLKPGVESNNVITYLGAACIRYKRVLEERES